MVIMPDTVTELDTGYSESNRTQVSGTAARTWDYNPGNIRSPVACYRSKTGQPMRNYKQRIARGQNATTPFVGDEHTYASIPALEHVYGSTISGSDPAALRKAAASWSHGIFTVPDLPSSSDLTTATNQASTRFYKQLSSVMTAFQGGIFLVELRETLNMIRNPAQALRKKVGNYIDHLSRKRGAAMRRPPSNRLKFLSDSWLEYSFGWSPLLNDLDSARSVLDRRANQLWQELIPVLGVGKAESTSFSTASVISGVNNLVSQNRQTNSTMKIYAGAVSSRASGTPLLTMSALGLSPRAFVPTLWEAVPWSFLIDYLTNVGDVLEAWSNQHVDLAWGRETTRRSTIVESLRCYPIPDPLLVQVFHHFVFDGKTIARKKSVSRSPITNVPIPGFSFELPGYGRKWINISALATARRSLRFR